MKMLNSTLAGLLLGAMALTAQDENTDKIRIDGAEVGHWTMDYDAACKLAEVKSLPMILNFTGSDWCGWCKLMDTQVFGKEEWKKFAAENVVLVTLDFPHDKSVPEKYVARNTKLKEQFGVRGFPTYIILGSDGTTQLGKLGAGKDKTPASFIEEFKGVVRTSDAAIAAIAKDNPDKAEAYKAAIAEEKAAKKAFADWIATGPKSSEENNKKFAEFQSRIQAAAAKLASF